MRRLISSPTFFRLAVGLCVTAGLAFSASITGLSTGKVELKSASQLAFGPDGIVFIGDSLQGAVFAIDTQDTKAPSAPVKIDINGINGKIAAMLGVGSDQILINDVKVNPVSKKVYLAVSRGRGPDGTAVILRIDGTSTISEFRLEKVSYSMVTMADMPVSKPGAAPLKTPEGAKNGNPRVETITDMAYVNGNVIVAGLSNEEFTSDLRSIPFPFRAAARGASIEIWHASHGRYETQAPVRTFLPFTIDNKDYVLAAYTCTPLVKIPVSDLKPGAKVLGTTIAELGNSNRPLSMLAYRKEGHDYVLMNNSSRGVMKLSADHLGTYKPITPPTAACESSREPGRMNKDCQTEIAGVPYQTLDEFKGVWQLAKLDEQHAVVLADSKGELPLVPGNVSSFTWEPNGSLDLRTIQLP